jgi:hypothetical protein
VVALQLADLKPQIALLYRREVVDAVQEQRSFGGLTDQIVGGIVEHCEAFRFDPGRVGHVQKARTQALATTRLTGKQNRRPQVLDGLQPFTQLRDDRRFAEVSHVERRLRRRRGCAQRLTHCAQ